MQSLGGGMKPLGAKKARKKKFVLPGTKAAEAQAQQEPQLQGSQANQQALLNLNAALQQQQAQQAAVSAMLDGNNNNGGNDNGAGN